MFNKWLCVISSYLYLNVTLLELVLQHDIFGIHFIVYVFYLKVNEIQLIWLKILSSAHSENFLELSETTVTLTSERIYPRTNSCEIILLLASAKARWRKVNTHAKNRWPNFFQ